MEEIETASIRIRRLVESDLEAMIAIDAQGAKRRRDGYLQLKLKESLEGTGIEVSLAAEIHGSMLGFLLARVYYGEFGALERVAVLDTIGVHPEFHHQGIADALMRQLRTNLAGLNIQCLRTEVSWKNQDLLAFFHHQGFNPATRLCLDLSLERP